MKALDIARGAYVRSPYFMRRLVAPLLSRLPPSLKYGNRYRQWRAEIERSQHDADFVEQYRLEALRGLLARAHGGSSYYRDIIEQTYGADLDLSCFDFDDLRAMPILTKDSLRSAGDTILAVPKGNVDVASTSGSSGQPLLFYLDKDRSVGEFAFVNHIWARCGFTTETPRCVIRDATLPNLVNKPYEWEGALRELRFTNLRLTPERMDTYANLIDEFEIQFIEGYPSAIEILARHLLRRNRKLKKRILAIFPISEPLFAYQREVFCKAFDAPAIVPFFGLSERVLLAGEAKDQPDVYEFEPLYGHAELVDDNGRPVTEPGQRGRLIGTGFLSTGQPFIRYDTGDLAELVRIPARDNVWRLQVTRINPRRGVEFLVDSAGNLIPSQGAISVKDELWRYVSEFQFFQDTPGQSILRIVPAPGASERNLREFVDANQERLGSKIRLSLQTVNSLGAGARGKRPFIDQQIDISGFEVAREYERHALELQP